MKEHASKYSIGKMAEILGVSRSGYYAWRDRGPSKRALDDAMLLKEILEIYWGSKRVFGSRKITKEINKRRETPVNHKRIERLMKEKGLYSKVALKYIATTDSKDAMPLAEDLLKRNFTASGKNEKWVSDTTYLWTKEGWLYVAGIIDLYGRKVVGLAVSKNNDRFLTIEALLDAKQRVGKSQMKGCILHSDQGSTYGADDYVNILKECGMVQSMSRKGDCWDNAPMESFWGKMKLEWFDKYCDTRSQAAQMVYEYVLSFYNKHRPHETNGYLTPEEYYRVPAAAA
jgi:putative transposase